MPSPKSNLLDPIILLLFLGLFFILRVIQYSSVPYSVNLTYFVSDKSNNKTYIFKYCV
jgi:hypothetical protein